MLKGTPVQPLVMPAGVVAVRNDWRYVEWADGGFVLRVGEPRLSADSAAPPASAANR